MRAISNEMIRAFEAWLTEEEKSEATKQKYLGWVRRFADWLDEDGTAGGESGQPDGEENDCADKPALTKEAAVRFRETLQQNLQPATVNTAVSALNRLFVFLDREDCRLRFLRVQKSAYRDERRDLTRAEYLHLVETARRRGNERLALVMETICACGLRVSELSGITLEAAERGEATIAMKGKTRRILIPESLRRKLLRFARSRGIASGPVFTARGGRPLSRRQIWAEMKALCGQAGVEPTKVFPHNLRHLFAQLYYEAYKDIVRLADILGHSSVNTTRIYLISTGAEHRRQLESLNLVC